MKSLRNRQMAKAVDSRDTGNWLIVPELSRPGRSTQDILEILAELKRKEANVYAIKGAWAQNGTIEAKVFLHMMALFAKTGRDLVSARTKEALGAGKAKRVKLGMPKGPGKSPLDQYGKIRCHILACVIALTYLRLIEIRLRRDAVCRLAPPAQWSTWKGSIRVCAGRAGKANPPV